MNTTPIHIRLRKSELDEAKLAVLAEKQHVLHTLGRTRYIVVEPTTDPPFITAQAVIHSLHARGIKADTALQVAPETIEELRQLAASREDFDAIELPDVENRLWLGEHSHLHWRESNLPNVAPEAVGHVLCICCGLKLGDGQRAMLWYAPTGHMPGMWGHCGFHLPNCP